VGRDETTQQLSVQLGRSAARVPALTILSHPDPTRVGERVRLVDAGTRVSRLEPAFAPTRATCGAVVRGEPRPIDDAFVSRTPLTLREAGGEITAEAAAGAGVAIAGAPLAGSRKITAAELDDGITIELGPRVALLLHRLALPTTRPPALELVGDSDAIDALRSPILRLAALPVPLLVRGETGSGKELVARAVHAASGRTGPLIAVNVAAIPPSTASSALFGHVRGAFTGAVTDLSGYFRDAEGGTLFLDEIGEIPLDVQAMLLRVLETSEVQPVGAARTLYADVRLIAATDRDLEAAVAAGKFREALLHRLAGTQLVVPPLRARRDDIGRLVYHFLHEMLGELGKLALLDPARRRPWLPPAIVAALARAPWPGNVRQLRNVVRQIAIHQHEHDQVVLDDALRTIVDLRVEAEPVAMASAPTNEQVIAALQKHGYRFAAAATDLGVSRARMYTLAERAGGIRTARDLSRDEIEAALAAHGNVEQAAGELRISPRALTLRMTELGIERR
jgi:two-component system, NtrC family, nitrogen regulation response regulator GlnG